MQEETIGPSKGKAAALPSKLPKTTIVKSSSAAPAPKKASGKVALGYTSYSGSSGKTDYAGTSKKYGGYAKSYQKGEMYQGASGTWYRDGKKVYAKDPGPATLKHPEAVQRAYNLRVSKDAAARARKKPRLKYD